MTRRKTRHTVRHCHEYLASHDRLEPRIALSGPTFTVTSNGDGLNGTLREAIFSSREIPDSTIDFDLKSQSTTIDLLSPLPPMIFPVTIDGTSQPGYKGAPLITVNGSGIGTNAPGFDFEAGSDGSVIQGLDITGVAGYAIQVNGASNVTIGGSSAGQGNIISGNPGGGIALTAVPSLGGQGSITSGTVIEGNDIGTGVAGAGQDANSFGILVQGANDSTIGGTVAADRNIISGNSGDGIDLTGTTTVPFTTSNVVEGNYIGTNAAGTVILSNGNDGINISAGATNNSVGGNLAGQGNLISGNASAGIAISGAGTSSNSVAGNQIGTDATGTTALANGIGVDISAGANNNVVGGPSAGARNVISGNASDGVIIDGSAGNSVTGDFIGTDGSGANPLPNPIGILVSGGTATTIGGTTSGGGNVISGNLTAGIEVSGTAVTATLIAGNQIGTNPGGTAAVMQPGQTDQLLARQNAGIVIIGSQGNTIGGTTTQTRNLISGNYVGVMLATIAGGYDPNLMMGNLIGTDSSGQNALGNIVGIYINGASGSQVGGTNPGSSNVISGNSSAGVEIYGSGSTANVVEGNNIGLAEDGRSALRGSGGAFVQSEGVYIQDASGNVIGGRKSGAGNVISGNRSAGVFILSTTSASRGNSISGNIIGSGENGGPGPGNAGYGIVLGSAPDNTIGRIGAAANDFSGNASANIFEYTASEAASSPALLAGRKGYHPGGPARHGLHKVAVVRSPRHRSVASHRGHDLRPAST
jgi:hypothetical protein